MMRGEIWWSSLAEPRGSEPGLRRPTLIVQSNQFNISNISTIIVAIITSNLARGASPGNVVLNSGEGGLLRRSVVNISQLITANRFDLTRRMGALSARRMEEVDAGLRLVLGLQ